MQSFEYTKFGVIFARRVKFALGNITSRKFNQYQLEGNNVSANLTLI